MQREYPKENKPVGNTAITSMPTTFQRETTPNTYKVNVHLWFYDDFNGLTSDVAAVSSSI